MRPPQQRQEAAPTALLWGVGGMGGQTAFSIAYRENLSHHWNLTASLATDSGHISYGAGTSFSW